MAGIGHVGNARNAHAIDMALSAALVPCGNEDADYNSDNTDAIASMQDNRIP